MCVCVYIYIFFLTQTFTLYLPCHTELRLSRPFYSSKKYLEYRNRESTEVFIHSWEEKTVTLGLGVTKSSLTFTLILNEAQTEILFQGKYGDCFL